MPDSQCHAFVDLVYSRFGALDADDLLAALRAHRGGDADFDLFLWSLGHRFRVDTEELLRRLGERWAADAVAPCGEEGSAIDDLERLIAAPEILAAAPLLGIGSFEVALAGRGERELRARCSGPRRCCSFFEGVARGLAARRGDSIRYVRKPESRRALELSFRLIGAGAPVADRK